MTRPSLVIAWLIVSTCSLIYFLLLELSGYTLIELTDPDSGRVIYASALHDGEQVALNWHNSLFDLDVTEEFTATQGMLIEHTVMFADPRGRPPVLASPNDLEDLFHTGGPFVVQGVAKTFTEITYRIGEIGNPKFVIRGRTIELKPIVGFGGRVHLGTHVPRGVELVWSWIRY